MRRRTEDSTRLKAARRTEQRPRLIVFADAGTHTRDLPPGTTLVVGRGEDCDVRVADDSVSRRHLAVHTGPPLRIEDLGSANGTFVGHRRVTAGERSEIDPSCVVEFGDAILTVLPGGSPSVPPEPAAASG